MIWFVLGLFVGVPVAYILLGLATAAKSEDLHSELWQAKVKSEQRRQALVVLVQAHTDQLVAISDAANIRAGHAMDKAMDRARKVLKFTKNGGMK